MSPLRNLDERYEHDAEFRTLVRQMEMMMESLAFTPAEMREAAVFASMRVEMRRGPKPIMFSPDLMGYLNLHKETK